MKQIKVRKHPNSGLPAVECVRCSSIISPEPNPLLDGYDCTECGHVFLQEQMFAYAAAVQESNDSDEDDEYGY